MKIGELFEPVAAQGGAVPETSGGVRAKRGLTINGLKGKKATLMPGQIVGSQSILAGLSGQWIIDHMADDVPGNWVIS
jgi:hypothetical protein